MTKALTPKTIESLKALAARREIPDGIVAGLYLVAQPSGAKSWALRYRFAGKPCKLTLGRWPVLGLKDARMAATDALERVQKGDNPAGIKQAEKAAQRQVQLEGRNKVRNLVDEYAKRRLSPTNIKTGDEVRAGFERYVLPVWGERDIQSIAKRDVIELIEAILDSGRGRTANLTLSYLGTFFRWCVERDILTASPADKMKPRYKEKARERVLSDAEIRLFWMACDDAEYPFGPMGQLLLLTGQRLREVAEMTLSEVDGDTWTLASSRTKGGRSHIVPLGSEARLILDSLSPVAGRAGYAFTTTGDSPVSGFSRFKSTISAKMAEIASEEAGEPVEIPEWRLHDLRRTMATGLQRLGVRFEVTEAILNHVSGSRAGVAGVYQRHDWADEKRDALERWDRAVLSIVSGIEQADNVVRLETRA